MTATPACVAWTTLAVLATGLFTLPVPADAPPASANSVEAHNGMVVCASPPAADVGVSVLKAGGNAVDAAVATAFAMAVTYPIAGNIGGGGFMVVYPGSKAEPGVFDYRETAPAAATKTMISKDDTWYGYKGRGGPGAVRRLAPDH